jgi:hypothetical protein
MKRKSGARALIEEILRKVPSELKVPSDVRKVLLNNVDGLRSGVLDIFSTEIAKMLSKVDFQRMLVDVMRNYTVHLDAKIDLIPKSGHKNGLKNSKKKNAPKRK